MSNSAIFTENFGKGENYAYILQKKVLLMTDLHIIAILNATKLMIHLKIQGCLDDSSSDGDIAVTSKRFLFHKVSLL